MKLVVNAKELLQPDGKPYKFRIREDEPEGVDPPLKPHSLSKMITVILNNLPTGHLTVGDIAKAVSIASSCHHAVDLIKINDDHHDWLKKIIGDGPTGQRLVGKNPVANEPAEVVPWGINAFGYWAYAVYEALDNLVDEEEKAEGKHHA